MVRTQIILLCNMGKIVLLICAGCFVLSVTFSPSISHTRCPPRFTCLYRPTPNSHLCTESNVHFHNTSTTLYRVSRAGITFQGLLVCKTVIYANFCRHHRRHRCCYCCSTATCLIFLAPHEHIHYCCYHRAHVARV